MLCAAEHVYNNMKNISRLLAYDGCHRSSVTMDVEHGNIPVMPLAPSTGRVQRHENNKLAHNQEM